MIYYFLTYIFGITLLVSSKKYYFLYFIIVLYIFPLSVYILFPEAYQYALWFSIICLLSLSIVSLSKSLNQIAIKYLTKMLVILILLTVSSIFFGTLNGVGPLNYLLFFKHNFWAALLFAIIISSKSKLDIKKYIHYFVVLQVVLGLLQYFLDDYIGQTFLISEYIKDGSIKDNISKTLSSLDKSLIVGTFGHVTVLGNFLSLYLVYWFGSKYLRGHSWSFLDYLFISGVVFVIILTGIRTSFITAVIGIVIILSFKRNYKAILYIIGFISILLLAGYFLKDVSYQMIVSFENPFSRLLSLIPMFEETRKGAETNLYTLERSFYILEFLDSKSFFIGSGIYINNPFGYGPGISSITDAMLVFVITEFGIIILFLVIMPYFMALGLLSKFFTKSSHYIFLAMFITLLAQTITDQGVFDIYQSFLFYFLAGSEINYKLAEQGSKI